MNLTAQTAIVSFYQTGSVLVPKPSTMKGSYTTKRKYVEVAELRFTVEMSSHSEKVTKRSVFLIIVDDVDISTMATRDVAATSNRHFFVRKTFRFSAAVHLIPCHPWFRCFSASE